MAKALILFDCDGTLVDSEYLNNLAVLETLAHFGVHDYDMDHALEYFVGLRFSKILSDVTEQTGHAFPPDANLFYLQKVRELAPTNMRAITGAEKIVALAKKHAHIGVVSNGERNNVLLSLEFVGLRKYFADDDIFTGLMATPKPAPDLYLLAAKTIGFKPDQILIIEDSITGVKAGVAANITVWGFTGTHHDPQNHTKALLLQGASKVFHSINVLQTDLLAYFCAQNPP